MAVACAHRTVYIVSIPLVDEATWFVVTGSSVMFGDLQLASVFLTVQALCIVIFNNGVKKLFSRYFRCWKVIFISFLCADITVSLYSYVFRDEGWVWCGVRIS